MFTKILVPLDGSDIAENALAPALDLAKAYKGTLILLCTCTATIANDSLQDPANDYDWFWPGQSDEPTQQEEKAYLDKLVGRLSEPNIRIQSLFVKGDKAGAMIGISEAQDVDLIVMTNHCQSKPRRKLLGDVTERVLYHASCSVMVICSNKPGESVPISANAPERNNLMSDPVLA